MPRSFTRSKKVGLNLEQSVIDYFIVCPNLYSLVESLVIDEDRKLAFRKYSKVKNVTKITKSDHNILLLSLKFKFNSKVVQKRDEVYNFKNKKSQ